MQVDGIARYIAKRAESTERWPLEGDAGVGVRQVVVIPCLGELENLVKTFWDLEGNDELIGRTLLICVVNNRAADKNSIGDVENNAATLAMLRERQTPLRLAWVDASSVGRELPAKEGVGLARKIGMDLGLRVLHREGLPEGALVCLDADTRVDAGYLSAIESFFGAGRRWAATIAYAHQMPEEPRLRESIVAYECFLRYHARGLAWVGSPYAFHTIGSTMACTARAYAAVAGMPKRLAGEDFYFMDKLAKAGVVEPINTTVVQPSARPSHRVPFGTGKRMSAQLADPAGEILGYALGSYRVLRAWLESKPHLQSTLQVTQEHGEGYFMLAEYLELESAEEEWPRIFSQARSDAQRAAQFHRWFDALRTLRAFHFVREYFRDEGIWDLVIKAPFWEGEAEVAAAMSRGVATELGREGVLEALRASDLRQEWRREI